jgi:enoyl-CoA hydratase
MLKQGGWDVKLKKDFIAMSNENEFIKVKIENQISWITIEKEKSLNALNTKVLEELSGAIELSEKERVRSIVITGSGGKAFVAGADISEMKDFNSVEATKFAAEGHRVFRSLEKTKAVTIAMIDGFTLGGGFELALSCDVLFATEKSKFGLPEVSLGLIPGFGGTQRLSRSVGLHLAKALTLSGDMVDAKFLEVRGVVYKTFADRETLMTEVSSYAKRISQKGPKAVSIAKHVVQKGYSLQFEDALKLEQQDFALLFGTPEAQEGMTAFLEKRRPDFK